MSGAALPDYEEIRRRLLHFVGSMDERELEAFEVGALLDAAAAIDRGGRPQQRAAQRRAMPAGWRTVDGGRR